MHMKGWNDSSFLYVVMGYKLTITTQQGLVVRRLVWKQQLNADSFQKSKYSTEIIMNGMGSKEQNQYATVVFPGLCAPWMLEADLVLYIKGYTA